MTLDDIPRPWIVDVGSGGAPVPFANILVEKFLGDTPHRTGGIECINQVLIEGDVMDLPFEDKQLDFVYCNHLLEHMDQPDLAMDELYRVSAKGMIAVPSVESEAVDVYFKSDKPPVHKWISWRDNIELCMMKFPRGDRLAAIKALMMLGAWPPNARTQWQEVRMCWGWGQWPERIKVNLMQINTDLWEATGA